MRNHQLTSRLLLLLSSMLLVCGAQASNFVIQSETVFVETISDQKIPGKQVSALSPIIQTILFERTLEVQSPFNFSFNQQLEQLAEYQQQQTIALMTQHRQSLCYVTTYCLAHPYFQYQSQKRITDINFS